MKLYLPETDVAEHYIQGEGNYVRSDISRKLERERGEANTKLQDVSSKLADALRERDEAREQIKELIYIAERAIDLADIDFENDKFGVVSELRDGVERIKEGAK
jgi:translation initiation factor 2 alpha subunit (eIF-2alpha)